MTMKHKVFVTYHHALDQNYREKFERICGPGIVSRSVDIGEYDPNLNTEYIRQLIRDEHLADSTVTVVLVGAKTWQRKHVDWEISSSIRDTKNSARSGLIGILLPTYSFPEPRKYSPYTIPPRLHDNIKCGFADIYLWSNNFDEIEEWIHDAFLKRDKNQPSNSRPLFGKNHTGDRWSN